MIGLLQALREAANAKGRDQAEDDLVMVRTSPKQDDFARHGFDRLRAPIFS